MAYPFQHLLLTFNWTTALGEVGQVGLRVNRDTLPSSTEMNGVHAAWGIFWSAANTRINAEFNFTNVKAALIRADGTYPPDSEPVYSTGSVVPGGVTSGPYYPLQVACAATLTTTALRGLASKGRIYLPPIAALIDPATFRWPGTRLDERAQTLALAIDAINDQVAAPVSVVSKVGAGTFHIVTGVQVGNRADVQRSRDKRNPETYSAIVPV